MCTNLNHLKYVFESIECFVDDFVGVSHRGVESGACKSNDTLGHISCAHVFHSHLSYHDAVLLLQHLDEVEEIHRREVVTHCARALEVNDRTLVVSNVWEVVSLNQSYEAVGKSVTCKTCFDASVVLSNLFDSNVTCHSGKWVSRQSTADVSLLSTARNACSHKIYEISSTAYAACRRITAGNDFAEDSEVRLNSEQTLRTAKTYTETGNYFVEDKQATVLVAQCSNARVVVPIYRSSTRLRSYRLYDNGSRTATHLVELEICL